MAVYDPRNGILKRDSQVTSVSPGGNRNGCELLAKLLLSYAELALKDCFCCHAWRFLIQFSASDMHERNERSVRLSKHLVLGMHWSTTTTAKINFLFIFGSRSETFAYTLWSLSLPIALSYFIGSEIYVSWSTFCLPFTVQLITLCLTFIFCIYRIKQACVGNAWENSKIQLRFRLFLIFSQLRPPHSRLATW